MKLGPGSRIFVFALSLVALGIVATAVASERAIRRTLEEATEGELVHHVRTVRQALEALPEGATVSEMDGLADRLGGTTSCRIVVTRADGARLADSWRRVSEPGEPEENERRIADLALRDGLTVQRTKSDFGPAVLLVAVPWRRGEERGALQASLPIAEMNGAIVQMRRALALAALAGVGAAAFLGAMGTRLLSRSLLPLVTSARALAGGEHSQGTRSGFSDLAAELDQTMRALATERDQTKRLEATRREFLANVAHELRTPVGIVRASAENLLDGALEDPHEGRRIAESLLRNGDRLSRLVSRLLDLARIDAGQYPLEIENVDVREAAEAAVAEAERAFPGAGKRIDVRCEEGLVVRADPGAVDQILLNLVENAIRHAGEVPIRISAERFGGTVRLLVEDEGPGVSPQDRERVFERFFRADRSRSPQTGGTGLGLAIVRELAQAMGGSVAVAERPGGGARFWVDLPGRVLDA